MIGMFLAPHVSLDIAQRRGSDGWRLGLLAGPLFANRRYDDLNRSRNRRRNRQLPPRPGAGSTPHIPAASRVPPRHATSTSPISCR